MNQTRVQTAIGCENVQQAAIPPYKVRPKIWVSTGGHGGYPPEIWDAHPSHSGFDSLTETQYNCQRN